MGRHGPAHGGATHSGHGHLRVPLVGCHPLRRVALAVRGVGHDDRPVVVDAEEVQRLGDQLQVAVPPEVLAGDQLAPGLLLGGRVAARQDRLGPHQVVLRVGTGDGRPVGGGVGGGKVVVEVEGDTHLAYAGRPQRAYRESVPDQQVMGGGQRAQAVAGARGVPTDGAAEEGAAPRLAEGDPARHPVAQVPGDDGRVLGEPLGGLPHPPAATVGGGLDAGRQQFVDHTGVEVQPLGVHRAGPVRDDAGPGDREPVGVHAQFPQQCHVLRTAVVVVAGDVTGVAVRH
ncbi:hypothetical protein QFZ43_008587 [Streptomyces afghaniensis]|nr:hypothetical protein [Streptomyces afghaniensis]